MGSSHARTRSTAVSSRVVASGGPAPQPWESDAGAWNPILLLRTVASHEERPEPRASQLTSIVLRAHAAGQAVGAACPGGGHGGPRRIH